MAGSDPNLEALVAGGLFGSTEALYRALVEQVPAVVYIDSDEQRPDSIYVSPQAEQLFGYPPPAYLADPELWRGNTHTDDRPLVAETWRQARAAGGPFECEYRIRHRDGRWIWLRDGAVPVRDEDGTTRFWQGVLHDITAQKEAEQAHREAEERYRALVENVPAVVYVVARDDDRRTLYVSPQVERALGYTQEEWLDQPDIWMELLHPDDREPTLAAHDLANETGRPWSREYRLIASDGRALWFRDVATLVCDNEGRPVHWQGVQLEITELKRAEEELRRARDELELRVLERTHELEEANEMMALEIGERKRAEAEFSEAEARYRTLVEQIPAMTYIELPTPGEPKVSRMVYVSPQTERILGYTPVELMADPNHFVRMLHPDDRERVARASDHADRTREPFDEEYRVFAKDDRMVWLHSQAVLVRDDAGRPRFWHGVALDITARKQAEGSLRELEGRYRAMLDRLRAGAGGD